jgi:MFS family permease
MSLEPTPAPADESTRLIAGRGLRAFVDGYMAVLLPAYLLALGFGAWEVGVLSTATLLGSAAMTLAVGAWGHRFAQRRLLLGAALLMAATGMAFAGASAFWPLLAIAFVGTLNPGGGDVSVFLPLEHARLAHAAEGEARTRLFARYSLVAAASGAIGALCAGVPQWLGARGVDALDALRAMFVLYAIVGAVIFVLYRTLPAAGDDALPMTPAPLGPSRPVVLRLAALFSLDSFAGGLLVQSLLALWLFTRFGLTLAQAGAFFFCTGLLGAVSQLAAPVVARRIGLLNTMVFTHIPASVALIAAAFAPRLEIALALLSVRALLAQMDVPARSAFVMANVTPSERAAAASVTAVPRSLAAAIGPTLGAALFASGWLAAPLVACGALKITYDLLLLVAFGDVRHEKGIGNRE